ncbi:hypothetical protein MHYP_G00047120 [Metynnis hypsauchen]
MSPALVYMELLRRTSARVPGSEREIRGLADCASDDWWKVAFSTKASVKLVRAAETLSLRRLVFTSVLLSPSALSFGFGLLLGLLISSAWRCSLTNRG